MVIIFRTFLSSLICITVENETVCVYGRGVYQQIITVIIFKILHHLFID